MNLQVKFIPAVGFTPCRCAALQTHINPTKGIVYLCLYPIILPAVPVWPLSAC